MPHLRGPTLALLFLLLGCVTTEPLPADETFRFDASSRGTAGERTILLDVTADFGSPLGSTIALDDLTTANDAIDGVRRIRVAGFRPQNAGPRGAPTTGHIEFREMAQRTVTLILEYKGHWDLYRVSMLPRGGILVEPTAGEWSRVVARP